ncbi:MAG TPA: PaaI family thioesterase [Candidatus Hodarchaeales archaeon]|nr:PaaI family thioesterase [Candidatus Hodarchaeales archaeon]
MANHAKYIRDLVDGKIPQPPIGRLIGMRLVSCTPKETIFVIDSADEKHHNPMGTVHGGIFTDIADGAMGMAVAATLGEGQSFTTINLSMQFFRPVVTSRPLTAKARVVHTGKTIVYAECDVYNDQWKIVAKGASTCKILEDLRKN